MGVVQTGAIYKGFTFDGIDSKTYGVYISGDAVFNAPERDVEMIEIPGRNGAFALDRGRFANITVTYPAGLFGDTEADFAQGISDLRNALASRKGYCRLEDEYNPNEYRMAVYRSGLEVDPAQLKAGEFEIVFDCKPQRFLKSGETAVSVASGGTITNPTLFESSPLLEVNGTGNIEIDGKTISIDGVPLGMIGIADYKKAPFTPDYTFVNPGDALTVEKAVMSLYINKDSSVSTLTACGVGSLVWNTGAGSLASVTWLNNMAYMKISVSSMSLSYGTSATPFDVDINYIVRGDVGGVNKIGFYTANIKGVFDGTVLKVPTITNTLTSGTALLGSVNSASSTYYGPVWADSTKTINPTYIDLDIGEAYVIVLGEVASANNVVTLPAELPALKPDANIITYDNTITSFKVTPRWWEV